MLPRVNYNKTSAHNFKFSASQLTAKKQAHYAFFTASLFDIVQLCPLNYDKETKIVEREQYYYYCTKGFYDFTTYG